MITFKKNNDTKFIQPGSSLIDKLIAAGWVELKKEKPSKKEIEDGKTSATGN